jgi:hypothetical protein
MERIARRFLGSLFLASGITLAMAGLLPAMAGLGVALSGVNLIARTIDNRVSWRTSETALCADG